MLSLRATAQDKYALAILPALFTDEEMGQSCYATSSRSTKPPLPAEKVSLLEGTVVGGLCYAEITFYWHGILLRSVSTVNWEREQ